MKPTENNNSKNKQLYAQTLSTNIKEIFVKIEEGGLNLFYFSFHFYFLFNLFFHFSIFRTTRVRVDWLCHHISHLMA